MQPLFTPTYTCHYTINVNHESQPMLQTLIDHACILRSHIKLVSQPYFSKKIKKKKDEAFGCVAWGMHGQGCGHNCYNTRASQSTCVPCALMHMQLTMCVD